MSRRDDDDGSFDPRRWARGGPATSARTATDPTSFDPRNWGIRNAADAPPAPASPADRAPGRRYALATASSVLILCAGGGAALLSKTDRPVRAPIAVATATPSSTIVPIGVHADASRRTLTLAGSGEVGATLAKTGIAPAAAAAATRAANAALGNGAGEVRLVIDLVGPENARRMTRLEASRADGSGVVLTPRGDGSFRGVTQQARLVTDIRVVRGEMDATSFYNAAVTAGVTDTLIADIAKALSYDFNFATDVHPGDIFEVAFEERVNPQGERVGTPVLVYVSLQTAAKSKALYRFLVPGDGEPGWYDGNGRSTVTALMRTPIDGARISSNFGMRFHPVLHYTRLHGGTDFAAPIGTPIYAAASGVVTSSSPTSCAGNMLIIRHDNGWETRYFHLSRYAEGVHAGVRVTQGQTVGAVGTTGVCTTGPHLHFEVHIKGQKVDPMSVDTGSGRSLAGGALAAFRRERDRIDLRRAAPLR